MKCLSISKIEEDTINEDAAKATEKWIAVSDGAGGGGVFADLWSQYLIDHIPNEPFIDFDSFNIWLEDIWEPFYNECEKKARQEGGLLLNKFYDEGSFATLAVVWRISNEEYHWISYGDSVAFHYNKKTKKLEHSFSSLANFNNPPYLINCKDEPHKEGFKHGTFITDENSIVFATTDALGHYIIMMYQVANSKMFEKELATAIAAQSKNSNYIQTALSLGNINFEDRVIYKLQNSLSNRVNFIRHCRKLIKEGLLAYDDYSITILS